MPDRAKDSVLLARYRAEVSETLHWINRLAIPPYLGLISYLAIFADQMNYPEFFQEMFVGRTVSMVTSALGLCGSILAGWSPAFQKRGQLMAVLATAGSAFMIAHFAAVMQNHFSAQTAWIVGNILVCGLYPISFGWSLSILLSSYAYYLLMYLGVYNGPINLQFQMTLMNSGIAGVIALAIKFGFIVIRKREFFSRVRLERANRQIASLNEQLTDENMKMSLELDVARRMQHIVLPSGSDYSDFGDLDIACVMITADDVGGDYYDIIRFESDEILSTDNAISSNSSEQDPGQAQVEKPADPGGMIAIGDVTGHGLNSGIIMMMVHVALRALSEIERRDLKTIYRVINKILYEFRIKNDDNRIMTLALLRYFGEGRFLLTGEHESMLRLHAHGYEVVPIEYGMYAGLDRHISDEYLKLHSMDLAPGETIVLYTDGITEAVNTAGAEFGQDGILRAALDARGNVDSTRLGPARATCNAIMQAAYAHILGETAARASEDSENTEPEKVTRKNQNKHAALLQAEGVLDDYSLLVIHRRQREAQTEAQRTASLP